MASAPFSGLSARRLLAADRIALVLQRLPGVAKPHAEGVTVIRQP